jgi:hypothetical protein
MTCSELVQRLKTCCRPESNAFFGRFDGFPVSLLVPFVVDTGSKKGTSRSDDQFGRGGSRIPLVSSAFWWGAPRRVLPTLKETSRANFSKEDPR